MTGRRLLVLADVSPMEPHGGAARVLREESRGLAARGHTVLVLCRHPGGEVPARAAIEGVQVVHYDVDRRSALAFGVTSLVGARRGLSALGGWDGWDAVICHQPFSAAALAAGLPRTVERLYIFHSPAGREYRLRAAPGDGRPAPLGTALLALLLGRLERRALRAASTIVVLSEFSRRVLRETHGPLAAPVLTIPGAADLERFRPPADRRLVRAELGLSEGGPLLLTVRDLVPRMGLDTLLRALAALRGRRHALTCVIGGSGRLRAALERLAADLGLAEAVRFAGHIADAALAAHYQAADLFVLPTRALEGFGLVTVEALACGTPVVATPVGATPEILGPLEPRLLAADASPGALGRALAEALPLAGDRDFRRRCRAHAERHYSWTRHVGALERALEPAGFRAA